MITGPAVWLDPSSQKVKLMGIVSFGPSKICIQMFQLVGLSHLYLWYFQFLVEKLESMHQYLM